MEPRVCGVPELQGLRGMARKNTIREARLASQTYAATLRRLTAAQALHLPDTLEAECMARTHHRRAFAALNT